MTSPITVWSKEMCIQCDATKRALDKHGIPYTERRIDLDAVQLNAFKALGLLQAPIVETPHGTWSGYRPDLIKQLAREDA